jgi:hypothetical protein
MGEKIKSFNFEPREKLHQHSEYDFDGKSDEDGPKPKNYDWTPINGPY